MTLQRFPARHLIVSACAVLALFAPEKGWSRDQIRVVGSSTVYPFSTTVAERLGKKRSFKTPVVEATGTGGGIKLFCGGIGDSYPDVANASRPIKDSELAECVANKVDEIIEVNIGSDGIVLATSKKGKMMNITRAQLWKAMAAKGPLPKNWKEIDPALPDERIRILTPPPTSGTRDAWNELVLIEGCDPAVKSVKKEDCALVREDGPVVEAGENDTLLVQKLEADPESFAIFGFSYFDNNRDKLFAATIEGKEVSLESIQDHSYPVARPLFFYVKKGHIGVIPGLKEFMVEFTGENAIGEEGYLVDIGLVPLPEEKLLEVRETVKNLTVVPTKK